MQILLVEDDDDHADLMQRALEGRELGTVHRAATIEDALSVQEEHDLGLAILDHRLPDGDGLGALKRLRARAPALPVLFVTGSGSEEVALEAIRHGALDYLTKGPGLSDRLAGRVEEVLEGWQLDGPIVQISGIHADDVPEPRRGPQELDQDAIRKEIAEVVAGPVEGALVLDADGQPLAQAMPDGFETDDVGRILAGVHEAIGRLRKVEGMTPRRYGLVVETGESLVALAAAPGPLLVALVFRPSTATMIALRRAHDAAKRIWEAS